MSNLFKYRFLYNVLKFNLKNNTIKIFKSEFSWQMYILVFTYLLPYYFFNSIALRDLTLYTFNSIEISNVVAKCLCKYNKFIVFNLYSIIIYENKQENRFDLYK